MDPIHLPAIRLLIRFMFGIMVTGIIALVGLAIGALWLLVSHVQWIW